LSGLKASAGYSRRGSTVTLLGRDSLDQRILRAFKGISEEINAGGLNDVSKRTCFIVRGSAITPSLNASRRLVVIS
jgi:hypothetical protein